MTPISPTHSLTLLPNAGSTYPLDLIRSRLSIATASIALPVTPPVSSYASQSSIAFQQPALAASYHTSAPASVASSASLASTATLAEIEAASKENLTVWGMARKVMREEGGVRALYRGLPATAFGVAPYVGINFAAYEALRGVITPPGKTSIPRKLLCGALAGKAMSIIFICYLHFQNFRSLID